MSDFLINDAIKKVWCTPNQDMQSIVQLAKLTPYGGVYNNFQVLWRTIDLPKKSVPFHVYQIGQLSPRLMGLMPSNNYWTNLIDVCNNHQLIVTLYGNNGIQLPRTTSWYMITRDGNLILAVQNQPNIPLNLNEEALFFRAYTNAYFNSIRSNPQNKVIHAQGKTVTSTADILTLQHAYEDYQTGQGFVSAFINGYLVGSIDLFTARPGDVVEFIYDSSVKAVHELVVGNLPSFVSELDSKHKYLLHFINTTSHTIDFYDDVDIYIYKPDEGRHKGVYYHRNQVDAVRMLTHKDYSIPVPYVLGYTSTQSDWTDPNALVIHIQVRNAGYDRPLVFETNRIKELYKLPDEDLVRAMIGVNAIVPEWTASNLEKAAYPALMRADITDISTELVKDAYGYNAISSLIGMTPSITKNVNGQLTATVPDGLRNRSTVFEYDAAGHLIDWHPHPRGLTYNPVSPNARLVEILSGFATTRLNENYQQRTQPLEHGVNYRFYLCNIRDGVPDNQWVDVTGTSNYLIANSIVTWVHNPALQYSMVRGNNYILVYDLELFVTDGVLEFSLTSEQYRNNQWATSLMQIPMGELRLFLNKKPIIENLDYVVKFPQIVILNKKYLNNPNSQAQKLTIVHTGFCKSDLKHETATDVGFVDHGILSNNNRFDIRDDKVIRIQVDGAVYDRSELRFAEDNNEVSVPGIENGAPYLLQDIVVPIRDVVEVDTYVLREQAQVTDKHVSDYLTLKFPPLNIQTPNVIQERYPLYSPFCSAIIHDLVNGILIDPRMNGSYNDNIVLEICQPYEHWLAFDPTQEENLPDDRYVVVHPLMQDTTIELDVISYRFLKRVVTLYLKDRIELSNFIELTT